MHVCYIGRGVRQRCSLTPLLYLIYDEAMIREATDENWNFSRWSYNYHCGAIVALGHGIVVPIVRFLLDQSQSQMIAVFIYYFNCISFAIRLSGHKVAN